MNAPLTVTDVNGAQEQVRQHQMLAQQTAHFQPLNHVASSSDDLYGTVGTAPTQSFNGSMSQMMADEGWFSSCTATASSSFIVLIPGEPWWVRSRYIDEVIQWLNVTTVMSHHLWSDDDNDGKNNNSTQSVDWLPPPPHKCTSSIWRMSLKIIFSDVHQMALTYAAHTVWFLYSLTEIKMTAIAPVWVESGPKFQILPLAILCNTSKFPENQSSTFHIILITDTDDYVTSTFSRGNKLKILWAL